MKIMIISSSPNTDGLTAACVHAAQLGVEKEGFETIQIRLNDLNIGRCHACGNGRVRVLIAMNARCWMTFKSCTNPWLISTGT